MAFYQSGNLIRLHAQFKDFDGQPVEPSLVRVIIYDNKYTKLEELTVQKQEGLGVGEYVLDYISSPLMKGSYFYEWYGEIEGAPSLRRDTFTLGFM